MKFDFKTIVIIALLLLIGGLIIFWPKPQPSETTLKANDSIARILETNTVLSMTAKTLEVQLADVRVKSRSDSARYTREITLKNQQLAKKRVRIDTVFKDNEVVQDYLQTADSVFAMMHARIDSLEREKQFQAALYNDLIYVSGKQISNLEMIAGQKDLIISSQEKDLKKRNRGNRLLKIGVIALPVLALIGGSQL